MDGRSLRSARKTITITTTAREIARTRPSNTRTWTIDSGGPFASWVDARDHGLVPDPFALEVNIN